MKPIQPFTLLLAMLLPLAAGAETMLDTNEDGVVSLDELQTVYPDISPEAFISVDSDGDALLDADELAAAREAGVIPAEES